MWTLIGEQLSFGTQRGVFFVFFFFVSGWDSKKKEMEAALYMVFLVKHLI
jgi:hypothetical protein